MDYESFLKSKQKFIQPSGFECEPSNKYLFEFQRDIAKWAIKKGKAAVFADCGLGKTLIQLVWANEIVKKTSKKILILAPLSVSEQTVREGKKFNIEVKICACQADTIEGINITNYEKLEHFNSNEFIGIVLDESSILKSFIGKVKNQIIDMFKFTPYKLACTATPAPNDFMELGNHCEFLGVMSRTEMLATYFVHDSGDTAKWRLKGHAENGFWKWVASWGLLIKSPNDLGYAMTGYKLPRLDIIEHIIDSERKEDEILIIKTANSLDERREARKESIENRVNLAADIVNNSNEQFIVWCDYNNESDLLKKSITGSIEVKGSDNPEHKRLSGIEFAEGKIKCLVSKPKIYGFGMNWQNCCNVIFCGLSDSYEAFYQAVRRCWRFGQTNEVNVHVIISEREINVLENIKRKGSDAEIMARKMIECTKEVTLSEIKNTTRITTEYKPKKEIQIPNWIGA